MNPPWEETEDSGGEEEDYEFRRSEKDALIFLIDASKDMFVSNSDESPFHMSIKCAHSTLSNKIISSEKDLLGIIFFGTEKGKNTSDFKHIYEFQNLDLPGAERIQEIEELMKCTAESFKEKYGHSEQFSISDALWTCSMLFSQSKVKLDNKRLLLFTNVDNPHSNNSKLHQLAKAKAKDLFDLGIDIDLMPIQKPGKSFDVTVFYKDIVHLSDDDIASLNEPSERFEELLTRVRVKDHKKRAQSSLLFTLGEGLQMGVSVYSLILPLRRPSAVKLAKSNNAELHSMTKSYISDTGEILMPSDKISYQEYGGKKIYLELDEVKQLKQFGEPSLLLMGFKPISYLKPHHHYRPSKFIYPNEKLVIGSTRLFSALLQQCHRKRCMAICRLIMRNYQQPKIVALVPQEEEVDDHCVQVTPPGFHAFFLPYMEDIYTLPLDTRYQPKVQMIEKAKEIIKKLQFTYNPESFENPVLQKHWRNIEALALNRDAPDEMTDYTMPQDDLMQKRAGSLIEDFKSLAFPEGMECATSQKKRQSGQGGGATKRARADDSQVSVDIKKEAEAGKLGHLTVNILKEFCRTNKIKCGSKKAEIIDAIKEFFGLT